MCQLVFKRYSKKKRGWYCKPVFDHSFHAGMSLIMRVCASKRDELDRLAAEEEFMEKEASAAVPTYSALFADRPSTSQG